MTTMQIPRGRPRIQYVADGKQTVFTYPFPIFASEDLQVWLDAALFETGFTITGAGETAGGSVAFDTAPAAGVAVLLCRRLTIERVTDFRESGPFTAAALNREFDTLTATLQQVADDQERMLHYAVNDLPAATVLPDRDVRAGQLLCFDDTGNPTVRAPVDEEALATFVPLLSGGVARSIRDKLADIVSVCDFGAVGDGVVDDTVALQSALTSSRAVFVPAGTYRITNTLSVGEGKSLTGAGQASVIIADGHGFDLVHMPASYATLASLRLENGLAGVRLYGRSGPCVQNALTDLTVWNPRYGLVLDGFETPDNPCYWNNVTRVLIARPSVHGVWLTKSGDGDTPNANHFHNVRVYSLSAPMTGTGFYIEHGKYNNAFVDCEANLWPEATACFRVGANTDKNLFVNIYAETLGGVPNIQLDAGSVETSITNLFSASAGPAIYDRSGGAFTAFNAGYPEKNRLARTRVSELVVEALRFDTEYVEPVSGGRVELDLSSSMYLVSSYGGPVEARLPSAASANGSVVTVKKTDASANVVRIVETDGRGPDGRVLTLGNRFDFVTVVSNGAGWWIVGGNTMPGNAGFHETPGVFVPDLNQSLYLVSAFAGRVEARLPAPGEDHAVGRTVTIKKADQSANPVTVTRADGGGPDNEAITLSAYGHSVTAMSNGAGWHILGRNP